MFGQLVLRSLRLTVRVSAAHSPAHLHSSPSLWAGHNKWSKVKNIKMPKDAARANITSRFTLKIRVAIKEGGHSDPNRNSALAQILEECRNKNIPKATIEGALKKSKSKTEAEIMYGATGPGGCMLLIQVLTDNNTRSLNDLKRILTKHSGAICDKVQHNFDRKGVVSAASDWSLEKALELAIEAGAEDVQETQDDEEKPMLQFICDASSMKAVQSTLESLGVHTRSSSIEFISQTPSFLNPTQLETASSLLETLINYEDVVRVWDNIHTQEN